MIQRGDEHGVVEVDNFIQLFSTLEKLWRMGSYDHLGLVHVPGSELEVAQGRVRRRRGGLPRVAWIDASGGLTAGEDARGGRRKAR